ncbi:tape measure protein [Hoylesella timonensis]|uniref:Tape measure domain protein n=1 Tax=Hoylesella timonensis CRIS 5C-B1 TaxID=679189 RepID=D1VXM6_9BACT|nr:tape measure protein [Hoylesella timonensis]EFA98186.1 tape measure domain protein [Hoylesella timonensis CRIS 5C-B1]
MAGLKFDITGDNGNMLSALHGVQKGVRQTQQVVEQSGQGIEQMFAGIKSAAVSALGAFSAQQFASKVMNVRGQFQQLEVAFETMLGSAEKANSLMGQLVKTAAVTPFDLQGVAQGAKQLLAYGIQADDVNETLVRLGDIAAGLSIPLNDLVYLYGTTMVQGRMFTMDLRQFQGRGIPIADELAKQFGVAKEKVGELVTAGKVGSEEMKKAIISMTSEGGKFAGLMEKQSHTITGQISNIEDAIDNMFNEIGKKSEGVINTGLSSVSYLVENWEKIGKVVLVAASAYGTYKAALLAVYAAHKISLIAQTVSAFFSLTKSVTTAKDAMLLFNIATKANPIGLVLGLIASAVAAFSLFSDSTDKATERQEKFGESADKASDKVETLFAILKTSSATSKVHKDALNELKSIADEYGVSLGKEENLTQNLIEKKEELIGLIREEAIERQRANDITDASGAYQQNIQKVKDKIKESLSDSFSEMQKNQLINLISEDDIKKLTSAYNDMIKAEKKSVELTGTWNSRFSTQQIEKYNNVISELTNKVGVYGKELGVNEKSINDAKRAVEDNGIALATTRKEYEDTVNATNKAAAAAQNAEMAADGLTESQRSLSDKTRMAKEDVSSLAKEISKMVETYNNSNINIQISYEELNTPPAWMIGVGKKLSSEQLKNLASLHQSRANRMRNHKEQTGRNLVIKNRQGVHVNEREEQVMAGQYAILAMNKKAEEDKKKRDAEEAAKKAKKNKKKYAAEKRRRDKETKRISEETIGRNKAIKDYEKGVLEQQKETELNIRQQNIDLKEESYEKEAEQINLNYDRLIAENDKRRKDMIEALKENKVNEWLNKNPKATKVQQENYRNSLNLTDSDLTATQNAQLAEYERIAKDIKAKAIGDISRSHFATLNSYLKEYGTFEEKKLAITKEYDEKIAKSHTEGERLSLKAEKMKALSDFDLKNMKESMNWEDLFGDLGNLSVRQLEGIKAKLREILQSDGLSVEDYKTTVEQIDRVNSAIIDEQDKQQSFFKFTTDYAKERRKLELDVADALKTQSDLLEKQKTLSNDVRAKKDRIWLMLSTMGVSYRGGIDISKNNDILDSVRDKYGVDSKQYKEVQEALDSLAGSTIKLNETSKKKLDADGKAITAQSRLTKLIGDFTSWLSGFIQGFEKINAKIQELPELLEKLGVDGKSDVGLAVQSFANASNNTLGAMKDFESGNYIGAVSKGISAIGDFVDGSISLFAGNGNEKTMEEEIARLSSANKELSYSIDKLSEQIIKKDNTNEQSIDAYKKAVKAEEEWQSNQQKTIDNRADEWTNTGYGWTKLGGKKSFNYFAKKASSWVWESMNKALSEQGYTKQITSIGNRDNPNDFWNLSPEEMKAIRTYANEAWRELFSSDGHRNPEELVNEYIERAGSLDKLKDQLNEKLTGFSWDEFRNNYLSVLQDMKSDTNDFAKNINNILSKSILESLVNKKYNQRIKEIQNMVAKAAEDGTITEKEANAIRDANKNLSDDMFREREQLISKGLLVDEQTKDQSASANGASSITYEQSTSLIALITAGNISRDQIKDIFSTIMASAGTLTAFSSSTNSAVLEIKNLMIYSNSHLEDILKYTKSIYSEFSDKIDRVNKNLMEIR